MPCIALRTVLVATAAFLPVFVFGQTPLQTKPSHLEFEVASVRPAPPMDASVKIGMHTDGAQVRFDFLSVRDCMRIAWQVKDFQIIGPDWIASDRFNITAKVPEGGASQEQVREMLRNLLMERFKLTFHPDKKEFAVYALVLGKNGLKMQETAPDALTDAAPAKGGLSVNASGSAAGVFVDLGQGSYYTFANNKLVGHKLTMPRIADTLGAYMDKPVVDMTGLPDNKNYDFSLDITSDDYRVMLIRSAIKAGVSLPPEAMHLADGSIDSLYSALDTTGLKMDPRKAPLDVMVIDHADKTPTEN
jgi:uncharacterized protein (TIGR03435 family)